MSNTKLSRTTNLFALAFQKELDGDSETATNLIKRGLTLLHAAPDGTETASAEAKDLIGKAIASALGSAETATAAEDAAETAAEEELSSDDMLDETEAATENTEGAPEEAGDDDDSDPNADGTDSGQEEAADPIDRNLAFLRGE